MFCILLLLLLLLLLYIFVCILLSLFSLLLLLLLQLLFIYLCFAIIIIIFDIIINIFDIIIIIITRGTDFPRSRNRGQNRGKAYLKRNSRFSAKILLITSKKHILLSKQTFQHHFENRNGQYLTTLIFVSVTPN